MGLPRDFESPPARRRPSVGAQCRPLAGIAVPPAPDNAQLSPRALIAVPRRSTALAPMSAPFAWTGAHRATPLARARAIALAGSKSTDLHGPARRQRPFPAPSARFHQLHHFNNILPLPEQNGYLGLKGMLSGMAQNS